jgi:hypothetical protein
LAALYAGWVIGWRCRPGNLWSDADGVLWNGRAVALVLLALAAVVLSVANL